MNISKERLVKFTHTFAQHYREDLAKDLLVIGINSIGLRGIVPIEMNNWTAMEKLVETPYYSVDAGNVGGEIIGPESTDDDKFHHLVVSPDPVYWKEKGYKLVFQSNTSRCAVVFVPNVGIGMDPDWKVEFLPMADADYIPSYVESLMDCIDEHMLAINTHDTDDYWEDYLIKQAQIVMANIFKYAGKGSRDFVARLVDKFDISI
ncbi:hypothetical protein [Acinetobacter sp.]|uniref:hypothetical protein n=1 Tax=Acinetobacter sp. TaxID=472 RepID=UPI003D020453